MSVFFSELLQFLPTDFPSSKTVKAHDRGLYLTCKATGRPKPNITWLKGNSPISEAGGLYEIETSDSPTHADGFIVTSTLSWRGNDMALVSFLLICYLMILLGY